MSNHLHVICRASDGFSLSDILRDFKKFTSKKIIKQVQDDPESRSSWMLPLFKKYCEHLARDQEFKFWQDGNHPIIISNNKLFYQKLNYIHQNPVKELIVKNPEDYLFSSARNYAELSSMLDIIKETPELKTY